jgi:hypothetical protein
MDDANMVINATLVIKQGYANFLCEDNAKK